MNPFVWLDDKVVSLKDYKGFFSDEGFLYGQGLFETMRTYNGTVFLLDRHIRRLIDSCPLMDIKAPDRQLLRKAVLETVKRNKLNSGYIRLNVWKRNKGMGIFVLTDNRQFYSDRDYQKGFSAIIFSDVRQNETSLLANVKSLNHYFYISLSKRAKDCGVDEGIILNTKGEICEGTRSNIFVVKNKTLLTPSIKCGCLPGITREVVIEIARQLDLKVKETRVQPKDLLTSKEAFLTNSSIEIMPLTKVNKKLIGNGRIQDTTRLILYKYRQLISKDYQPFGISRQS